jgi:hypothetical protein
VGLIVTDKGVPIVKRTSIEERKRGIGTYHSFIEI